MKRSTYYYPELFSEDGFVASMPYSSDDAAIKALKEEYGEDLMAVIRDDDEITCVWEYSNALVL